METVGNTESEIISWLEIILEKENLKNLSVEILGGSEKGDGYMGDVVFLHVSGITEEGTKEYNLVLKCSKRNKALRENSPVKNAFLNEIYVYETVLPTFTQFQLEKGIEEPFRSVAKCYGTFISENMEVIAFENLKKSGYFLWDRRNPLLRKHINMVVREYGKLHAISVAMNEQKPEKFKELSEPLIDVFQRFVEIGNMDALFGGAVQDAYDVLQNDLDKTILTRWKEFKQKVKFVFEDMIQNFDGLKVITHGDCWNNNFMFYSDINNEEIPSKVAILDWQLSRLTSPIFDLSYFLFTCISEDDVEDFDAILEEYYLSFSSHLSQLGSNPEDLYPLSQFLNEWTKFCKFGIFLSATLMKMCTIDKEEVPDMIEAAEKGEDISNTFIIDVKDKTKLAKRMRHIVKYAVENDLI